MSQQAFERFLTKHIHFSPSQREQGAASHTHIREVLASKADYDSEFPWLVNGDFLSGSYARGTKIYPLDDIDVMMVLDGAGLSVVDRGVVQDIEVRGSGSLGSPVGNLVIPGTTLISPHRVLEVFRDALKETYPNSEIKKDGQAVNVWLDSYGLGIDIVPCFHLQPRDGSRDYYYIAQGGGSHEWIKTNPYLDKQLCDGLHETHDKKLKPVIRLLKYWNKEKNAGRLKAYHLDVLVWKVFLNHPGKITNYPEGIKYFFDNIEPHLAATCPDLWELSGPVDAYLSFDKRQETIAKVREVRATLSGRSLFPNQGLVPLPAAHSINQWRKIFGPELED